MSLCSLTLILYTSCKLWAYSGIRFPYPFSQYLARDWNLTSLEMSAVLSIGEFASVPAGFFSPIGDILGPYLVTNVGLAFLILFSYLLLIPNQTFPSLMSLRFCLGFFQFIFMVAVQTTVANEYSLDKRDSVTGILELSYSISALLLVPLLGLLYDNYGWQLSFLVIALVLSFHFPLIIYINKRIQKRKVVEEEEEIIIESNAKRKGFRAGITFSTGALTYNLSGMFLSAGVNLIATEFGFLVEDIFKLSEANAGTASLAVGFGELCGVLLSIIPFGSSFKALEIVGVLLIICFGIFTIVGTISLPISLTCLFFCFVCGEFCTVQRISRACSFANECDSVAMLGSHIQFQFLGRTIGAAIASPLFFQTDHLIGHEYVGLFAIGFAFACALFLRISIYLKNKFENKFTKIKFNVSEEIQVI